MGFIFLKIAFRGVLFAVPFLPLVVGAGREWAFFRPPSVNVDSRLFGVGNPSGDSDDDDQRDGSLVLFEHEDDSFADILASLVRYLWLGFGWTEIEDENITHRHRVALEYTLPHLRLYDYEPNGTGQIDPEFLYHLIERGGIINNQLNERERLFYLLIRAEWMEAYMSPEDALQAWGVLAIQGSHSCEILSLLKSVSRAPWLESYWRKLSGNISGIEEPLTLYAITRLAYSRFRLLHPYFKFSDCMPWLLVLPGLTEEERESVRSYLHILIREHRDANSSSLADIYRSFSNVLINCGESEDLLLFIETLFNGDSGEVDALSYFFYLRSFCMLCSDTNRELLLLNKITLLLSKNDAHAAERGAFIFEELSSLMSEGILSEKAYQFCLALLCTPLLCSADLEPKRIAALGVLLSDTNLGVETFKKLWKAYALYIKSESQPISTAILRTLPSILSSQYLSSKIRRLCFERIIHEDDYDGAFIIEFLLDPSAPESLVVEGVKHIVEGVEMQISDAFWDVVKVRLPELLARLSLQKGHWSEYYERIIEALEKLVRLPHSTLSEHPSLYSLPQEATEILLKHWGYSSQTSQKALDLLFSASLNFKDRQYLPRLWRWLFIQHVLNEAQLGLSIDFLLNHEDHGLRNAPLVLLGEASLDLDLRKQILIKIYKELDLRLATTLLLKDVSWVQGAKLLYGMSARVLACTDKSLLHQLKIKLIESGYLAHKIQQALTARYCDAIALRFLHAAQCFLQSMERPELMDEYLAPYINALTHIACQYDIFPELSEASEALLDELRKKKLIHLGQ